MGLSLFSRRAEIVSRPFLHTALSSWYHCSSLLRTKPFSKDHTLLSGVPSVLNSSFHTRLYPSCTTGSLLSGSSSSKVSSDQLSIHFRTGYPFSNCMGNQI